MLQAAIRSGECDPSCDSYIDVCGECFPLYNPPPVTTPPSCPAKCEAAIRSGQCDPSCDQYNNICGPCIQTCPARCKEAFRLGKCGEPSCLQFSSLCGPCTPPTEPPAAYLPPPGQGGSARSFLPSNTLSLPARSGRNRAAAARRRGQRKLQRLQRQPVSRQRNNWDLFLQTGLVTRRGG